MDNQSGHVMTLANSIIGVSILAMPYCFKQCGIVLSVLMLLISSIISRLACHFLLKSAIIARRKTFEYLAFHIFGSLGKLSIEIGIIGFLLGTCVAFFVVMGDLGPEIVAEMTGIYTTNTMRTSILMALALFCVLPLGLLRNVDSLNGVSKATIGFYCCLVLKIVFEAIPHIFTGDWYDRVVFWRPAGILQCLPIFSMALFCQTQLFEIYQALQNATLEKMNNVVRIAVNICTCVYIFVGVFGYIAFSHKQFTGNILLSFSPSFMTDIIKIGFVLSVAFSFPLVIFPCRASLYSLLYKEGYSLHEGMSNYIPEGKFKGLTMFIVFLSLIIGIMIPNIELVLGLVGSTIGVMICVIFPVTCFICISPRNTNERILAQLMLMIGVFVMVLGTYKNLYTLDSRLEPNTVTINSIKNLDDQLDLNAVNVVNKLDLAKEKVSTVKTVNVDKLEQVKIEVTTLKVVEELKEVRHEPPQPIEPQEEVEVEKKVGVKDDTEVKQVSSPPIIDNNVVESDKKSDKLAKKADDTGKSHIEQKNDEVDAEAIRKEDQEVELQKKEKVKPDGTNQELIDTIQEQNKMQKKIVEQQNKLLEVFESHQKHVEANDIHKVNEEKLKAMKQIETIALKAIEKIGGGKEGEKVAANLEKHIEAKVQETVNQNKDIKGESLQEQNQDEKLDKPVESGKVIDDDKPEQQQLNNVEKIPDVVILPKSLDAVENPQEDNKQQQLNDVGKIPDVMILPKSLDTIEKPQENVLLQQSKNSVPEKDVKNVVKNRNEEPGVRNNGNKSETGFVPDKKAEVEANKLLENVESPRKIDDPVPASNNNTINNINNTAPLFLKLGKAEQSVPDANLKKMVPLPLAVSNNLLKDSNMSKAEPPDQTRIEKTLREGAPPVNKDEIQAIRRDILMLKNQRR